jgi:uncharacterized membrane protein
VKADKKEGKKKGKGKGPPETPPWKKIGKAVVVALLIDAVFLAALLVPVVGFVLVLIVGPYTGAMVAGKWLRRDRRGEWLWATFWVTVLWPSALTALIYAVIISIGPFQFVLEPIGGAVIAALYILTFIFTTIGFYQGAMVVEEKKAPKKKEEPKEAPAQEEKPVLEVPDKEKGTMEDRYPGEGIDE